MSNTVVALQHTLICHIDKEETESTLRLLAEKDVPAAAQQQEHDLDLYAAQKALAMDRIKPREQCCGSGST